MRLQYIITREEFIEAVRTHTPKPLPGRRSINAIVYGVVIALVFIVEHLAFDRMGNVKSTSPPASSPPQNLWTLLAPASVSIAFLVIGTIQTTLTNRFQANRAVATDQAPAPASTNPFKIAFAFLPYSLLLVPMVHSWEILWHPSELEMTGVVVAPWFGFIALLIPLARLQKSSAILKAYAIARSSRRPIELDISDQGITTRQDHATTQYQWSAFDRYQETKHLLKLITLDELALLVPKRAFVDDQSIETFRSLIQTHIPTGSFLPRESRFAVLPAATNGSFPA